MMLLLALIGCQAPCALDAAITPGCGVELPEGELRIGDESAAVERTFGAATTRSLGHLGNYFAYPGVSGMYRDGRVETVTVHGDFDGATALGVGIGADDTKVKEAYGNPVEDGFAGTWWFRDAGIAVHRDAGLVTGLVLFAPL